MTAGPEATGSEQKPAVLVSACLLGVACTHRGEGKSAPAVETLRERYRLVAICPEVAGGLSTPRPSAEVGPDGRVRTAAGDDVTSHYQRGAVHAVDLARAISAEKAILKARSPSCGSRQIYDGSHTKMLKEGEGITCRALRAAGVEVLSEEDL